MKRPLLETLIVAVTVALASAAASVAAPYTPPAYTLQVLPGGASAISNTGWIAGTIIDAQGVGHPYRWRAGKTEMLRDWGRGSSALAVNDNGEVVGTARPPVDMPVFWQYSPAVLFGTGTPEILGIVSGGDGNANAINNQRQIVGTGYHDNLLFEAFLWENGAIRPLPRVPDVGGISQALAINNSGHVVGWNQPLVSTADEGPTAVLWRDGSARALTTHGVVTSQALDLNDAGLAVGWIGSPTGHFQEPMTKVPVSWDTSRSAATVPLAPGVQGTATAVNSAGLIVGNSASGFALLFAAGGAYRLQNLLVNAPGWTITRAQDINDAGQILVWGSRNGVGGSLLLTPVPARYQPSGGR